MTKPLTKREKKLRANERALQVAEAAEPGRLTATAKKRIKKAAAKAVEAMKPKKPSRNQLEAALAFAEEKLKVSVAQGGILSERLDSYRELVRETTQESQGLRLNVEAHEAAKRYAHWVRGALEATQEEAGRRLNALLRDLARRESKGTATQRLAELQARQAEWLGEIVSIIDGMKLPEPDGEVNTMSYGASHLKKDGKKAS